MIKQTLTVFILSFGAFTACTKTTSDAAEQESFQNANTVKSELNPHLESDILKLIQKTKKNMIFVEGGEFLMGDFGLVTPELEKTVPNSKAVKNPKGNTHRVDGLPLHPSRDNKNLHKVTLSSFSMNAYKTTIEDFNTYAKATGNQPSNSIIFYSPNVFHEVAAGVSWLEAQDYCKWLGVQVGMPMDLPTEAQWEYVARNRGQYILFATDTGQVTKEINLWSLNQYHEYGAKFSPQTLLQAPVLGKTPPNPLGFYDLVTNNYEWIKDWYSENYPYENAVNPEGPKTGKLKVLRSSEPMSADNLEMAAGLTVSRSNSEPEIMNTSTSHYLVYSVRCASNSTKPIKMQ